MNPRLGCALIVLLALCVFAGLGLTALVLVPNTVVERYGPPSESLSPLQRINLQMRLLSAQDDLLTPVDAQRGAVGFTIRVGESPVTVASRLEEAGLVRNSANFRDYLVYKGLDTRIQAGNYQLSAAKTAVEIADMLQDATPAEVEFNVWAGWRLEEIAQALPTSGLGIAPEGFLQVVSNPPTSVYPPEGLPPGWEKGMSLEGLLMPGSYSISRNARADNLAREMLTRFNQEVDQDLRDAFAAQGLDLRQAVTLASIVQREAVVAEEQPVIASVFYNRIAANMKLESDPTTQYALGYNQAQQTWWTNPLSAQDLKVNSPYNTYWAAGLPPGPICNPSLSALRAVAYPAQTPYLFFRAACDRSGTHKFSTTFQEHLGNACP